MRLHHALIIGFSVLRAHAGVERVPEGSIEIYLVNTPQVPSFIQSCATQKADRSFRDVGLKVRFHTGKPPVATGEAPIVVHFVKDTDSAVRPHALAYAYPFEGSRIDVVYSRVERLSLPRSGILLAYVLVHEIAHILQGTTRHSMRGIMKAAWDGDDQMDMLFGALRFLPEDVAAICDGIAVRRGDQGAALSGCPRTQPLTQSSE